VQQMVAINGQFVPINPSEFHNQMRCKINVGLGTGTKEQQASRIMGLMQVQMQGVPLGIVGPQQIAESIRLYAEAQEYKNPERFVSPEPSGMPPNPEAYNAEKQQAQQQMQEMQEQLQQMGQENEGLKAQATNKDGELQLKGAELELKHAEFQQRAQESEANFQLQAHTTAQPQDTGHDELASQVAEQSQAIEQMAAAIGQLGAMVQGALSQMAQGPKQVTINRGPTGDIEGGVIG
ncbi:MAG: hypothetical protein M3R16_05030, partial [Pseudomonadota bacterium]|nr:hypothetical protein [Pseudomonadota bacterium]